MPASLKAPAIEALTPSPLTAPMLSMRAATVLPSKSKITVLAVVEPKSTPIAYDFIAPSPSDEAASGRHPLLGLHRLDHRLETGVQELVLVEGLIDHVPFEEHRLPAPMLCCVG